MNNGQEESALKKNYTLSDCKRTKALILCDMNTPFTSHRNPLDFSNTMTN